MTDQDLRQVLLDAVPPLPPPPDRIQSIARRVRRERRRIVVVSVAASTAVVVGAVAAFAMVSSPPVAPLALPSPSRSASPSHSPSPAAFPPASADGNPTEPPAAAKVRLKAAAEAALHRAVPGATITKRFPVQYMDVDDVAGYNVGMLVTAGGRRGSLVVTVKSQTNSGPITCADQIAPDRQPQCKDKTGPHGEHIVSLPFTGDSPKLVAHVVIVLRTDDSVVTVISENTTTMDVPIGFSRDETTDFGINTSTPTGKNPPLTVQQITALALDPALTLYP